MKYFQVQETQYVGYVDESMGVVILLNVVRAAINLTYQQLFVVMLHEYLLGIQPTLETQNFVNHEIHKQHLGFLLHHRQYLGYVLDKMEDRLQPVLRVVEDNQFVVVMIVVLYQMANIL